MEPIMTPAELKAARHALGLSRQGLADMIRLKGEWAATTVRRWETGELDIPGYAQVILDLALNVPAARKRLMA
jgi:DNA-binding transcriptional regulator YiaG